MKLGELYQIHLCPRPHHPGASGGLFVRDIEEKCVTRARRAMVPLKAGACCLPLSFLPTSSCLPLLLVRGQHSL